MQIKDLLARYRAEARRIPLKEALISLKSGLNPRKFFTLNTPDATGYYVTVKEMVNGKIVFHNNTDRINQEAVVRINQRSNLEKGDVLFSSAGTIGKTAYVEEEPHNWDVKEGIFLLKANQDILLPKYLYYYVNSPIFKEGYFKYLKHGGTMNTISMSDFKEVDILVPSLEVQKKIVAILEEAESAYCNIINTIPSYAKAINNSWQYTKKKMLSFENEEAKRIELNNIDYITIANNKRKPIKATLRIPGNVPYYGANCIQSYVEGFTHEGEYILIAEDGTRDIEDYSVQWASNKFWANNHVHVIQGTDLVNNRYLYFCCQNVNFRPHLTAIQRPKLTKGNLEKITIPIPSLEKQKEVVETLDKAYSNKNIILEDIAVLLNDVELVFKSILHRFFSNSTDDSILIYSK